jgi:hypothetical protein
MNKTRITDVIRFFIEIAMRYDIPKAIISKATTIPESTLERHFKFTIMRPAELYAKLFVLYASSISVTGENYSVKIYEKLFPNRTDHENELRVLCQKLELALEDYLKLDELKSYLEGLGTGAIMFTRSEFTKDISEPYKELFKTIYGKDFFYDCDVCCEALMLEFLHKLHTTDNLPDSESKDPFEDLKWTMRLVSTPLPDELAGMSFGKEMQDVLITDIDNLSDTMQKIIKSFYGLNEPKKSLGNIAKDLDKSPAWIGKQQRDAINILRRGTISMTRSQILTNELKTISKSNDAKRKINELESQNEYLIFTLEKIVYGNASEKELADIKSELLKLESVHQFLMRPIKDLKLPERVKNLLLGSGMSCLNDVMKRSEKELLKIRKLGIGGITDINDLLGTKGYALKK